MKALTAREKVLGTEHPDTAGTYNNIARVYHNLGDHTEALEYYQKVLNIREKALGAEHPDTITSYGNMASVHDKQDDYTRAI